MKLIRNNLKLQTRITLLVCSIVAIALLVTDLLASTIVAKNTEKILKDKAISTARIVANDSVVIEALTGKRGQIEIQNYASRIQEITKVEFVVVMDMEGIRKSHPNESKIGKRFVGGDELTALSGEEYVSTAKGTLGMSLRAFTPIYDYSGNQIGAVAVGIMLNNVNQTVSQSRRIIYIGVGFGFLAGALGAMMLARSVKNTLLGLEPSEISKLLEERSAMLQSVREGIIAVNKESRITLINSEAIRIFKKAGIKGSPIGKKVDEYVPNTGMTKVLEKEYSELNEDQDLNGIKIITNRVPIVVNGEVVGAIATFRDKTEIQLLAEQLTGVKLYAEALRAQTHEFMNKLHVILGMVHMEFYDQLSDYIKNISNKYQAEGGFVIRHIKDPVLSGFILGKISYARECGAELNLSKESILPEPEDEKLTHEIITIIGNLIDNGLDAVAKCENKVIDLSLVYDEGFLKIEVIDTGLGISKEFKDSIFKKGYSTKGNNRGYGLYLVKQSIEALAGSIEVISEIDKGTKFVICLPYKTKGDLE